RFERGNGIVVSLERELGQTGQEPRTARRGRVGGHRLHRRQRFLVIVLIGVYLPQRDTRAIERRVQRQCRGQIADRRGRSLGQQPLDVPFKRGERRMRRAGGRGRRRRR